MVSYQSVCFDPVTLTSPFPPNSFHWPNGYFPLLGTILCKPWRCSCQCENPSRWAARRPAARLAPTSTRSDAQFELQEVVFSMSTYFFYALSCCNVSDGFGFDSEELNRQHIKWLSNMYAHMNDILTTVWHKLWWSGFVDEKEGDLSCLLAISAWGHVLQLQCFGFERFWKETIHLRVFFRISVKKLSNLALFSRQTQKNTIFIWRCIWKWAAPDLWPCHSSIYIHSGSTDYAASDLMGNISFVPSSGQLSLKWVHKKICSP